jgi:hypothetical protein
MRSADPLGLTLPRLQGKRETRFKTPAYRSARAQVVMARGRWCYVCGAGGPGVRLDAHHIDAYRDFPSDDPRAMVALCATCHPKVERGLIQLPELQA